MAPTCCAGSELAWTQLFGGLAHVTYAVATDGRRPVRRQVPHPGDGRLRADDPDRRPDRQHGRGRRVGRRRQRAPGTARDPRDRARVHRRPDTGHRRPGPAGLHPADRPARSASCTPRRRRWATRRDLEVPRRLPDPHRKHYELACPAGHRWTGCPTIRRIQAALAVNVSCRRAEQQRPARQEHHGRRPDPAHRLRLQRDERPDVRRRRPGDGGRLRPRPDPRTLCDRLLRLARPRAVRTGQAVRHRRPVHLVAAVRRDGHAAERLPRRGLRLLAGGGSVALGLDAGPSSRTGRWSR